MPDLSNAIAQFTYSEEKKNFAESLRRQFLERFPPSSLRDLTLEQYSLGLEPKENSFCYWLEFKTRELGSCWGNTADKFIVHFNKNEGKFKFPNKYRSKEDAFASVKSGILELLRLGKQGRFAECENVPPLNTKTSFGARFSICISPSGSSQSLASTISKTIAFNSMSLLILSLSLR